LIPASLRRRGTRLGATTGSIALALAAFALGGCGRAASAPRLRLAATHTVRDAGLLDPLVSAFEKETGLDVESVVFATGQVLALGARGDADVLLVHDRAAESRFVAAGHATSRGDAFWNRFLVVGPPFEEDAAPAWERAYRTLEETLHASGTPDPATGELGHATMRIRPSAAAYLRCLSKFEGPYVSRGDDSGTHRKERALLAGVRTPWPGYLEAGQGMAGTLRVADRRRAATLTDEATWLRMRASLDLVPRVEGDFALRNDYGALLVAPAGGAAPSEAARRLYAWLTGPSCRAVVTAFSIEGRRAFFAPDERAPTATPIGPGELPAPTPGAPPALTDVFVDGTRQALRLLVSGDADTWHAVWLSLWTAALAVLCGACVGVPFGTWVGLMRPKGAGLVVFGLRVGMSVPTVVIGLVLYGVLCRRGVLGGLDLLYTPTAILIGDTLLAAPILASHAHAAAASLDPRVHETVRTHGGGTSLTLRLAMAELRPSTTAAVLSAFGRCISEVGIALAVGGSIRLHTRTLPALVTLETSKGEFGLALAPGLILVIIACGAALVAPALSRERRR